MKQRNGNKDRATHNIGHDVAKTRLSAKLNLDIYPIVSCIDFAYILNFDIKITSLYLFYCHNLKIYII